MSRTYLFYDIETSGLNKCFDQVLQFAAIRTDLSLNELERHHILIKPNPDVMINPEALLTNRISIDELKQSGISEFSAMQKIHALFNTPDTISVGYNNLGFDDEFLRFSFYRNLLSPYKHQYANGCSRLDLYPVAVLYFLFKEEALLWPQNDKGISLKLEFLSAINKLHSGVAHDARSDTEATLALAKHFAFYKDVWDYALGFFNKALDLERIKKLSSSCIIAGEVYPFGVLLDGVFGYEQRFQTQALCLGWHNHYKNQTLWLKLDEAKLATTNIESIPKTTYVYRKKIGEGGLILPSKERFLRHFNPERQRIVSENQIWLAKNPDIFSKIKDYHCEYKYPFVPNVDVDACLYEIGFLSEHEEMLCRKFHVNDLKEKIKILNSFSSDNLRARAVRILGRNYRTSLPKDIDEEFNSYLSKILNDDDIGMPIVDYMGKKHLTRKEILTKIEILQSTFVSNDDDWKIKLLLQLKDYFLESM